VGVVKNVATLETHRDPEEIKNSWRNPEISKPTEKSEIHGEIRNPRRKREIQNPEDL